MAATSENAGFTCKKKPDFIKITGEIISSDTTYHKTYNFSSDNLNTWIAPNNNILTLRYSSSMYCNIVYNTNSYRIGAYIYHQSGNALCIDLNGIVLYL